jgi:uncharacterized protein (TIGR02466 family)
MKRYDFNLFSIPLISIHLSEDHQKEIYNEYLPKVYAHKEKTESIGKNNLDIHKFNYTSNTDGYTSFYTGSLLEKDEFISLQKYLNSAIKLSLVDKEKTDKFDLKWMDFWYTIYDSGKNVEEHFHPNSIISGVYYLKCPDKCGDIIFLDNNYNYKNYCVNISPLKTFTYPRNFSVAPKEGMILLFPSWLTHKTEHNKSKEDRIMFAFNIVPTKQNFEAVSFGSNSFFNQ